MPGLNLSRPGARRRRSPDAPNRRMVFTEAQKKAAGEGRVSRNWRTVFLLALAETSCVKHAAKAAGVADVVFDRGGNRYAGRVAAIADGAREGGLNL